ncbi:MAG: hypothetical protein BEN19_07755 [Epulopiscium sp. Nuni2H_MBin003]|nr:MAG: hypothetical protein BEN19_07755 [Epulopiscium sp. Nuni2H_MBin003]
MRCVPTNRLRERSKIAADIFNKDAAILLPKEHKVTKSDITKLKEENISIVYVLDEYCYDEGHHSTIESVTIIRNIMALKQIAHMTALGIATNELLMNAIHIVNEIIDYFTPRKDDLELIYEPRKLGDYNMEEKIIYMAMMSTLFALKLNFNKRQTAAICLGALLRDVSLVTPNVKWKSGENNKKHPLKSYEYLKSNYNLPDDVLQIILYHEELYDGSGYIEGLKGESIPKGVRVMSIIDLYYSLQEESEIQCSSLEANFVKRIPSLDPNYLGIFRDNVSIYKPDTLVELTNKDIAVVINQKSMNPFQPHIKILKSNTYEVGEELALYKIFNLNIQRIVFYVD